MMSNILFILNINMNNSCRNFSKQTFNGIDANDFLLNKQKAEQKKLLYIWYSYSVSHTHNK